MTLEELFHKAAKSGRLNYFSVCYSVDGWTATYRGVEDKDFRTVTRDNPVAAIIEALTGRKPKAETLVPPAKKVSHAIDLEDLLG